MNSGDPILIQTIMACGREEVCLSQCHFSSRFSKRAPGLLFAQTPSDIISGGEKVQGGGRIGSNATLLTVPYFPNGSYHLSTYLLSNNSKPLNLPSVPLSPPLWESMSFSCTRTHSILKTGSLSRRWSLFNLHYNPVKHHVVLQGDRLFIWVAFESYDDTVFEQPCASFCPHINPRMHWICLWDEEKDKKEASRVQYAYCFPIEGLKKKAQYK